MYGPVVIVLIALNAICDGSKLPHYFQRCSKTDPNLEECILKSTANGWSSFTHGDAGVHVVPMNPLQIPFMQISMKSLKINFTDAVISGLEDMNLTKARVDLQKRKMDFEFNIARVNLLAHYSIDGRLMILPINGEGSSNITFIGGHYKYSISYDLPERKGKHYIEITSETFKYELRRSYMRLENLFNGDKQLGEDMNQFLDENWKEINTEIGSKVGDDLGEVVTSILQDFFRKIPMEELFLE